MRSNVVGRFRALLKKRREESQIILACLILLACAWTAAVFVAQHVTESERRQIAGQSSEAMTVASDAEHVAHVFKLATQILLLARDEIDNRYRPLLPVTQAHSENIESLLTRLDHVSDEIGCMVYSTRSKVVSSCGKPPFITHLSALDGEQIYIGPPVVNPDRTARYLSLAVPVHGRRGQASGWVWAFVRVQAIQDAIGGAGPLGGNHISVYYLPNREAVLHVSARGGLHDQALAMGKAALERCQTQSSEIATSPAFLGSPRMVTVCRRVERLPFAITDSVLAPMPLTRFGAPLALASAMLFLITMVILAGGWFLVRTRGKERMLNEKIKESQAHFDAFFSASSAGLMAVSPDYRIQYANSSNTILLRIPKDEMQGALVSEVLPPGVWNAARGCYQTIFDGTRRVARSESSWRTPAGDAAQHWTTTYFPIMNADGGIAAVGTITLDTSELVNAVKAARFARDEATNSRKFFQNIFDMSASGILIIGASGTVTRVNQSFCDILGKRYDEIVNRPMVGFIHPSSRDAYRRHMENMLTTGMNCFHMELQIEARAKQPVWGLYVGTVVRKQMTGVPEYYIAQIIDITATKNSQQSLLDNEKALIATSAALANAQRIAKLGSWTWEPAEGAIRWSAEMCRILGIPVGQKVKAGSSGMVLPAYWRRIHPDDRQVAFTIVRSALRARKKISFYHRIVQGDGGAIRYVQLEAEPEYGVDGQVLRAAGIIQDITEQKSTEDALNATQQRLRSLVAHQGKAIEEERKRIARDVHDELGQMLAAMSIGLEGMKLMKPALDRQTAEILRLQSIVKSTIETVRYVTRKLRPPAIDLGIIPSVTLLAEEFSLRHEIPCHLEIEGEQQVEKESPPTDAIYRVVQEALTNIARHASATQCSIHLTFRINEMVIVITDNGCGFDFESKNISGGFGLMGMRERILSEGGRIDVKTHPGEGTVITISLLLMHAGYTAEVV